MIPLIGGLLSRAWSSSAFLNSTGFEMSQVIAVTST
jgi:hypothetical protein